MKNAYTVTFKRTVVANNASEAEKRAREYFAITDPDVSASMIESVTDGKEKELQRGIRVVNSLFGSGLPLQDIQNILQAYLATQGCRLDREAVDAIYEYCDTYSTDDLEEEVATKVTPEAK